MNNTLGPVPFDEMVSRINAGGDELYKAIQMQVKHKENLQTFRKMHWYVVDGSLEGQGASPFFITTDQGYAFDCKYATGKAFSYDAVNPTDFPCPNGGALTDWACDGLSVRISHSREGVDFSNGAIPFPLLFAPGYSISFQNALPFEYIFPGNSKIKFDMTNRDNVDRTHTFAIVLGGFLVASR